MKKDKKSCFRCDSSESIIHLYGYPICDACHSKLGLFTDETIKRYKFNPSFRKEINYRLGKLEKDYIRKKIKLLYILERLKKI